MEKSKSTIEVNGKRYDASTGALLGATTAPPYRGQGKATTIDGFFRPRATASTPIRQRPQAQAVVVEDVSAVATPPSAPEVRHAKRNLNHTQAHSPQAARSRAITVSQSSSHAHSLAVRRGPANHVHHHSLQHSQTLRRDAVPAPTPSTHTRLKPQGSLQHAVPQLITVKKSAAHVDPDRLARAQQAPKSPLISRHSAVPQPLVPIVAPVDVQPMPTPPAVAPTPTPSGGEVPTVPPPQPNNKPSDIFEHALANANHFVDARDHNRRYKQKVHTHVASMAFGSFALIIIAAFVAYQNNPGLQFKLASFKSGVSASMPNLTATGFSYRGVRAGDGKLTVGLTAGQRTYQLTQANTNLSDGDMIQSISATDAGGEPTYSVVQAGTTTVYRFSNTDATWVSGGKWYTVSGTGSLTNDQVKTLVQHV